MRVFKLKAFAKFCRKEGVGDEQLMVAAADINDGKFDTMLGGGVFKQRIARQGEGKSGGYRTIVLMRFESRAVFVLGFAKKDRENITSAELKSYRDLAATIFELTDREADALIEQGYWMEVVP